MNDETAKTKRHGDKAGRIRDILLVSALAILLIFAVWKIFDIDKSGTASTFGGSLSADASEEEKRLSALLEGIDGVGKVNVMICEKEGEIESVVVVCQGANDLRVNMHVREAAAAALGTQEKSVKIYLMKE